jgi:uncharacterized membrane protein SirB2
MPYQVYKMLHIVAIVIFFSSMALASVKQEKSKKDMIITGVSLVMILVAGMGLMARLGISHGAGWPTWIYVKFGIWFTVGVLGHVIMKRFPKFLGQFYWISIVLLILASYMATYKIG